MIILLICIGLDLLNMIMVYTSMYTTLFYFANMTQATLKLII